MSLLLIAEAGLLCGPAFAQSGDGETFPAPIRLVPQPADRAAGSNLSAMRYHILRARTDAGRAVSLNGPMPQARQELRTAIAQSRAQTALPPRFFPSDLSYLGGVVIRSAVFNDVYVDCPDQSCWGNPQGFQIDLINSRFIHLMDQYVGARANKRYGAGHLFTASTATFCTSSTFCSASDILGIVHAVATQGGGNGYGVITNVFLPQGVDTCQDANNSICYSPDNPPTAVFCAYHGHNVFSDIGETLFTVEPFQDVPGCAVEPGSPNGQLSDSTDSTLLHETFETITDPDSQSWIAMNASDESGQEIGDVCQEPGDSSGFVAAPIFRVGRGFYELQLMYSDRFHDCTSSPSR